ncbi:MAG: aminopeptidase P family protein [Candidatus Zixiibacteriota bacterium]
MKTRIKKLQQRLNTENLDVLLVSDLAHIRYLVGFTGSSALLFVFRNEAHFFTDFRYKSQSAEQVEGATVHIVARQLIADAAELDALAKPYVKIGYESEYLTQASLTRFQTSLVKAVFLPTTGLVEDLAMVKDKDELSSIKGAVRISDIAFERILGIMKPGVREDEIAAELEYQMKMLGSSKPAFDSIIASGYRAALPHGIASSKKLKRGEFVTLDFGATYEGYVSDITRTVVIGKATTRQKRIYDIVAKAQLKAISVAKAGISCQKVDAAARKVIYKAGYGKKFGHGLGHGIGLVVHELPRLSPEANGILQPGHVVTIEPGIYIPNWGGVRIEDDVVIRRNGCTVLNKAPKELIEL